MPELIMINQGAEKASWFYYVNCGAKIWIQNPQSVESCKIYFYTIERPLKYLYTYDYSQEQHLSVYNKEKSVLNWNGEEYIFSEEGYIRVSVSQECSVYLESNGNEADFIRRRTQQFLERKDVQEEIEKTIQEVQECQEEDTLIFTLLSDTHYIPNGTFEETVGTIRAVNERVHPDGIIHLGDLTDGILSKSKCEEWKDYVLGQLKSTVDGPLYLSIGNHDCNYFYQNRERLTNEEQRAYYLPEEKDLWYIKDYHKQGIRLIFLHSFDFTETYRYGFTDGEIHWLEAKLDNCPKDWKVIIFCHEAPLAKLDYWTEKVRNGDELVELLERWNLDNNGRMLGFFHGHTHADFIYENNSFPIVSVGCSKCEYFEGKRPEGSVRYHRHLGEVTQVLWDTMIIHPKSGQIELIRFGAGRNRTIRRNQKQPKPYIWAHRGASGYAPENTLEAFAIAMEMGADGIELDVQYTKDRQLVVIHDEKIDRTSNGTGYVQDYTLEELKQYKFNRTHPSWENATIPTLEEVLMLVKDTEITVNIELKTGIIHYEGIEKDVLSLVKKMNMEDRVIFSSFNHTSLRKIRELDDDARIGILYADGITNLTEYAKALGAEAIHPEFGNLQYEEEIKECQDASIKINTWSINTEQNLVECVQRNVDAVITNYPDLAQTTYGLNRGTSNTLENHRDNDIISYGSSKLINRRRGKKRGILHICGIAYSYARKPFVWIDRCVNRMAGQR